MWSSSPQVLVVVIQEYGYTNALITNGGHHINNILYFNVLE